MELLYIDESGDDGFKEGSSRKFVLAGVAIKASLWKSLFWQFRPLKLGIAKRHGIEISELKCNDLFDNRGKFFNKGIPPRERQAIYEQVMHLLTDTPVKLFAVLHDKSEFRLQQETLSEDKLPGRLVEFSCRALLTSFEKHLVDSSDETEFPVNGLVFYDRNQREKLVKLTVREFARKYDEERKYPGAGIVEDVRVMDSTTSYFLQLADFLAFSIRRIESGIAQMGAVKISEEVAAQLKNRVTLLK